MDRKFLLTLRVDRDWVFGVIVIVSNPLDVFYLSQGRLSFRTVRGTTIGLGLKWCAPALTFLDCVKFECDELWLPVRRMNP
jgi:hypothetical protein